MFNCPFLPTSLLLYLVIILLLLNSRDPTEGILPPQAREIRSPQPTAVGYCLCAAPNFLAAPQALIVHPVPTPVFLGKPKRVVSRTGKKETRKFSRGRWSPFLALRQSQTGELCTTMVIAVCLVCKVLSCSTHATGLSSLGQRPAAVGRLKLLEQQKGNLQVP